MSDGKSGLQLRTLLKKSGELELSLVDVPTPEPAEDEVVVRVRADFIRMAERHAQLAERYGRRHIAQHLVLGALNADGWAKFHWVHSRHHFGQIDRLLTW